MRHRFSTSQWVAYPHELVFAFFADPRNLPALMPPWQKTRIVRMQIVAPPDRRITSERSAPYAGSLAGEGSDILISFRPFPLSPIRLRWRAVISDFRWNHFCDQQQSGPFAFWKHCHYIREESRFGLKGTVITDEVLYEIGRAAGGELAHRLFFSRQLEKLFHYRQQTLTGLLEAATRKAQISDEVQRVPPAREISAHNQPRSRSAS